MQQKNCGEEPQGNSLTERVAIMVTRRCNMACAHCSVESAPGVRDQPDEAQLMEWVRQSAAAGVRSILFSGGEPMIRENLVLRLMQEALRHGVKSSMTSNGFWGQNASVAGRRLRALRESGLVRLTVSYDRFHAEFQGPEPLLNICSAADKLGMVIHVSLTRTADDPDLDQLVAPFRTVGNALLSYYDVQPVGNARHLAGLELRHETEGFCSACDVPAITDDGRMMACNGPSYFAKKGSPLYVGDLRESSVGELAERHLHDPILDTIRTFGPHRLREELATLPGFQSFPFRDQYQGTCELCHQITNDSRAVTALREHLTQPRLAAERVAMQTVMDAHKKNGVLDRDFVNGVGICREFLRAAGGQDARWTFESHKILGRCDVDWNPLARYLITCGFARPLVPALDDDELKRFAPEFFVKQLQDSALASVYREIVQREAMRRISSALSRLELTGVLLKGAAILARSDEGSFHGRTTSDIDLYIEPSRAADVRSFLLQEGFDGSMDAPPTGPHHLAPIYFKNVPIEIHTRVMPSFWGLPEGQMLAHTVPVPNPSFQSMRSLDAEGMFLHAATHATAHLFSFGLKTAWDLRWIVESFGQLDCGRLVQWVDEMNMPRAFWVPVRVLADELEISVPSQLLKIAPNDSRQHEIELIARKRLFQSSEDAMQLNPFSKNGVFLLMHDTWSRRLGYLRSMVSAEARQSRRSARGSEARVQVAGAIRDQLGHAIQQWRQFRRARARATIRTKTADKASEQTRT